MLTDKEIGEMAFWYFRTNFKSQNEAAEHYGVTAAMISAVANGKRCPNKQMREDLGIKRVKGYIKKPG